METSVATNGSAGPQTNGEKIAELKSQVNGNGHQEQHDENQYLDSIKNIIEKGMFLLHGRDPWILSTSFFQESNVPTALVLAPYQFSEPKCDTTCGINFHC
jgi:hypothetical protein